MPQQGPRASRQTDKIPVSDRLARREYLALAASAGVLGTAGCSDLLSREPDTPTTQLSADQARSLAAAYAPQLYFDASERWFPTDPRPYETTKNGDPVVDGFTALDSYTEQFERTGDPPEPTVFYRVVEYQDSPLAVVQYWLYSAFDQFSTNFHWHDWELVQVFVDSVERSSTENRPEAGDTETDEPQLFVASAHSRKVPNNEFLDPDPDAVPRILPELGSHSSALSLNTIPETFQRLPSGDTTADITNRALGAVERLTESGAALPSPVVAAVENRQAQSQKRARQARDAGR